MDGKDVRSLGKFLSEHDSIVILSGAGVSTASGIPAYRDQNGVWKHAQPMLFQEFMSGASARARYWSRSYVGWQRFSKAEPNAAHQALFDLESSGRLEMLVTQNVDGLHRRAGSKNVVDLHGDLGEVRCTSCEATQKRARYQEELEAANPDWHAEVCRMTPDGDAVLAGNSHEGFSVPDCPSCGGVLKPDVVMFGESVPKVRVQRALEAIDRATALIVVGSSLMVFSGFRFARYASSREMPIAIVNQGCTRADDIATLKVSGDCGALLSAALQCLSARA